MELKEYLRWTGGWDNQEDYIQDAYSHKGICGMKKFIERNYAKYGIEKHIVPTKIYNSVLMQVVIEWEKHYKNNRIYVIKR